MKQEVGKTIKEKVWRKKMPDISMCLGIGCSDKEKCWRYTAIVNEYGQAFSAFHERRNNEECSNFWPNDNRRNRPIINGERAPMFKERNNE